MTQSALAADAALSDEGRTADTLQPARYVDSDGVQLAVYTWGRQPSARQPRPTLLLVHGYPDSAEVWTAVAERLAKRYFVVAYDVRGAGRSSAPRGTEAYALKHLVNDLAAVADAVSPHAPLHLVGHDWGALQGWEALLSEQLAGRIASYSTAAPSLDHAGLWFQRRLSKPTPRNLLECASQILGSAYIMVFQLPLLPELAWTLLVGRNWPRLLARIDGVQAEARPTQTADGQRGLGLYRANVLQRLLRPQPRRTEVPVQLLVMQRDPFVPQRLFECVADWTPNLRRTVLDAGHWAPLSHPQAFAEAVSEFVTSIEEA
ncbi:alpha/beta fold hydrolase [Nevskia sp.]|uniref:alpha/beta fold hydrolase n=1 Tax=Nevskia sp. TaxID=1929292 RepID=UPI0025EE7A6C|nr:alpha/beta fold hydrolase [Nevskia sp.]